MRAADYEETATLIATSFGVSPGDEREWLKKAGHDNIRVLREDGRPVAALIQIPMAQFFGGRSVPMVGIAGVACPPELRGSGAATDLMKRNVRELRRRGVALSGLYPAVQSLYQRAGYALAGTRYETRVLARDLGDGDRTLKVRGYVEGDRRAVERLYRDDVTHRSGYLNRGSYIWRRVREHRFEEVDAYVVEEGGALTGYVFFVRSKQPGQHLFTEAKVRCMAAKTPRSRRRLLTLLGDLRSLTDSVYFFGAPYDERLAGIEERRYEIRAETLYMLRIVDVRAALEARGYSRAVTAELHIELSDDVIRKNSARYRVVFEGGRATVRDGGRGSFRLDARALAQLFSGYASAHALARRGALDAKSKVVDVASGVFATSEPVLADMF